jgi:hypothetical protein
MIDGTARLRSVLVLTTVLLVVSPAGVGAVGAAEGDATETARTVAEIEAHLQTSVELVAAGDRELAAAHAQTVVDEQWPVIAPQLEAQNASLAADLGTAIEQVPTAARNDSTDAYEQFIETEILAALPTASAAVVPADRAENASFSAGVVAGLLERASAEYTEGVAENGSVTVAMDYRTAVAYADQAEQRYNASIAGGLDEGARSELAEMFDTLDTRLNQSAGPSDVQSIAGSIEGELAEYTAFETERSADTAVIERIEGDLEAAVEAYEAGNESQAQSLVKGTYLSNFEGIEGTLIEQDPALVEELEADFNDRLLGLFAENASVSAVEDRVATMEERLERAETILAAQEDTAIDLGEETTTEVTDTTTAEGTDTPTSTTGTEAPGFTAIGALLAVLLGAAAIVTRR